MVKIRKSTIETLESKMPTESADKFEVAPSRIEAILLECEKSELTLPKIISTINDSLMATKTTIDKYGDEHVEADFTTRLRGCALGLQLRGDMSAVNVMQSNTQVNISIEDKAILEEYSRRFDVVGVSSSPSSPSSSVDADANIDKKD